MKRLFILFALVLVVSVSVHGTPASAYKQKQGYVPDADAAVLIATAILIPIYGQQQVMFNLPMSAALKDGIWRVTGKLPPGMAGGVAEVKISQATGKILGVIHGDMPMAPNKLDQVAFPGASLKWIHIAEPEFKRLNINLDDYTIHVWDKGESVTVWIESSDAPKNSMCMGSCGSHLGHEVEISKKDSKIIRQNYVR